MRVVVLGGTGFLGSHIVRELISAGHTVSVLSRGQGSAHLPDGVERLRGDREAPDGGLSALRTRNWDVCIDTSGYLPRSVEASVTALADVTRYVFISAVATYGEVRAGPVTEEWPQMTPVADDAVTRVADLDNSTYGPCKVRCEQLVHAAFGDRATVLRPQVVTGPGDPSGRYTAWLARAARPGPTLAPGDGRDALQVIDVRDLARFTRLTVAASLPGVFNLAGPRLTWADFMGIVGAIDPVWVSVDALERAGVSLGQLPLFRPAGSSRSGLMDIAAGKALAAGLTLTDPARTAADTRPTALAIPDPHALKPEQEAAILRAVRAG